MNNYSGLTGSVEGFIEEHFSLILSMIGVSFVLCILMIISLWKLFVKSGEKGWKSLIPFYNILTLMKIIDMNRWLIILMFIPFVQLFFYALLSVMLANRFGKGVIFAIGILFLPFIFIPILAFSKCELVELEDEDDLEDEDCIYCPKCNTKLGKDTKVCFVCQTEIGKKEKETQDQEEKEETIKKQDDIFENDTSEQPLEEIDVDVQEDIEEPEVREDFKEDVEKDVEKTFEDKSLFNLEDILKELNNETGNLQKQMDTVLEEVHDEPTKEENEKQIDDNVDVDEIKEDFKPYEEKKFKSSTKTLDDILKINQDLYSNSKNDKQENDDSVEDIEILDIEPEEIEKEEPKSKKADTKICPSCGSKVPSYSTYCIFCGEEVK